MLSDDIRDKVIAARSALTDAGIEHLAVFGSRARGQARVDSDLDLLLDILPGKAFSLFDLVGVEHTVSKATGLRANAFLKRSLDAKFKARIEPDLIEIF
jgi:predicted nucleotidyltransferase